MRTNIELFKYLDINAIINFEDSRRDSTSVLNNTLSVVIVNEGTYTDSSLSVTTTSVDHIQFKYNVKQTSHCY